jgi:hypothetical protein
MSRRALSLVASIAVLCSAAASASDGQAAWEALGKRVSELDRYSVKVAVSIFETEASTKPATLMVITAARDGNRYHYKNGPIEIVWATNRTVVVNHSARRIIVRAPHSGGATPAAILSATTQGADGASGASRAEHRVDDKGTLFVEHDKGPVQRIEVRVDSATGLPVQALVTYRRGARLPDRVSMTYDWSTGASCQCPAFDDSHLLRWVGDTPQPHSSLKDYHVVRLDRP